MNTLEQLKRAKEREPKAVLVLDEMPENCFACQTGCINEEYSRNICCGVPGAKYVPDDVYFNSKPDWCPLRKAIALIEPDGHVAYLREEEQ